MSWHCPECGRVSEKTEARYTSSSGKPVVLCLDCGSITEEINFED